MTAPFTAEDLIREFDKVGVALQTYDTHDGAFMDGRTGSHDPKGLMYHWTATTPTLNNPTPGLWVITDGRGTPGQRGYVPPPLYNMVLGGDRKWLLICLGKANHAGRGNNSTVEALIHGNAPMITAADAQLTDTPYGGGNTHTFGVSVFYHPNQGPMEASLYEAWVLGQAAICNAADWHAGNVMGHSAYTPRKWDFPSKPMVEHREDLELAIEASAIPPQGPYYDDYIKDWKGGWEPGWITTERFIDSIDCPTGGAWTLTESGGVITWGSAPYYGGANLPYGDLRMADGRIPADAYSIMGNPKRIVADPDTGGYTIITDLGYGYGYNPATV